MNDSLFYNAARARQLVSYHHLVIGPHSMPTDLDGLIEYQDRCYVLMEYKYGDAPIPQGQSLALMRLCDDLSKVKPTILIVARHHVTDPTENVDGGRTIVDKYRLYNTWYPDGTRTVRELTAWFIQEYGALR